MAATKQKQEESVGVIHVYSYKLLNEHIKFLYPKLKPLEKSIKQSMMPIPFEVYVSSMVFFSLVAGIFGVIIGIIASQIIHIQPAVIGYLLPPVAGISLMAMTFGILQIIPAVNVKNRSTKLLEEIPHFIGYMSTLATSGLSLEDIFKAISKEETGEDIVKDARFITRNVEILGMDLLTAVKDLVSRTPPGPYSELLEGAIVTAQSGGNLKEYFNATAKVQLEEKRCCYKKRQKH